MKTIKMIIMLTVSSLGSIEGLYHNIPKSQVSKALDSLILEELISQEGNEVSLTRKGRDTVDSLVEKFAKLTK